MNSGHRRILLLNLATVAVAVIAIEFLCRIVVHKIYNRDFDKALITDSLYLNSSGLKANACGIIWGKKFSTDEFASRKPRKTYKTGKRKWLFIGDSVTEGVGVEDSAVFSSLVFDKIDSVNILNYSLIGYSIADYLNVLKTLIGAKDSGISRATLFFCLNDIYGNSKANELPRMASQNVVGTLNAFLQQHYATYKLLKLLLFQNSDRYFRYDLQFYKPGDEHFIEAMHILKQCDSVCVASGIKMNVVMLPYRSQLQGGDEMNKVPQNMVAEYCNRNGIQFSDVSDYLKKQNNPGSLYLFADEIHFSERGHRTMADYLLSR